MKPKSIIYILIPASLLMAGLASAAPITFDVPPYALGSIGAVNGSTSNAPFTGQQGWSRSTSDGTGTIITTTTSGEYTGGFALDADTATARTYIGGKVGIVDLTGANSITFDTRFQSAQNTAGFFGDSEVGNDFDNADVGMIFGGVIGSGPMYRHAGFDPTINSAPSGTLTNGLWYRFSVLIGASISGNRSITMAVRDLTNATDLDINGGAGGNDWTFSVTDAQFGVAPESAVGGSVRVTRNNGANLAGIDNITFTAVPEPGTLALLGVGGLAIGLGVARRRWRIGSA